VVYPLRIFTERIEPGKRGLPEKLCAAIGNTRSDDHIYDAFANLLEEQESGGYFCTFALLPWRVPHSIVM